MAIWLEIHCDAKFAGPPDTGRITPYCMTDAGVNPGILAGGDRKSMSEALHTLEKECLEKGWKRRRSGYWMCPPCLKWIRSGITT